MENDILVNFYENHCNEEERLLSRHGNVEFVTTMKYIKEYLGDDKNAKILELGAATGRYSIALADMGYRVTAVELVEHNLKVLKSKIKQEHRIVAEQGNAMDLSRYEDASFDMTLVLGPMYHLYNLEDKKKVMEEAVRVTKKGGVVMVAYCMNEAVMIHYMFGEKLITDYMENDMFEEGFKCKSKPEEIIDIVRIEDINQVNEGFPVKRDKIIATDGAARYLRHEMPEFTEEEYRLFIEYHLATCERYELLGASDHVLDILQKG